MFRPQNWRNMVYWVSIRRLPYEANHQRQDWEPSPHWLTEAAIFAPSRMPARGSNNSSVKFIYAVSYSINRAFMVNTG